MPKFLAIFKRVVEIDMAYSYLVFYMAISLGTMFEFLFIIGVGIVATTFLLTVAHFKNNWIMRLIGKFMNIAFTITAFINIFASDIYIDN